ncbi:magnesium transporter CorA family protein [Weissella diestrammenae]|uniref:Magnesium transporter CorA family protein n=1 Tax=Weissella diestrammenae TaxID=1162633 RepID=A0A7G9T6X3_9LACO|nr:magnesium transporter CorA family protein [Weissella diestrammenae]MCM0582557.1 magnesium transporter CorA family protein [Weissella diestrammenae]QNN75848.1 magnesium transporter CorA family protein [Weissella diestrammenae]
MITTTKPFNTFTWLQVHKMAPKDREQLYKQYHISNELINYAIDPYESARIELDDQAMLIIFDVVTPTSSIATTEPVGLLIDTNQQTLVTFTRDETSYITTYIEQIVAHYLQKQHQESTPVDVLISALTVLASKFQSAILEINRRRNPIQREIRLVKNTQGKVDELMDLQTDLIYLLNSLHTDFDLLSVLAKQQTIRLTPAQIELVEDTRVELNQAIDTGELSQMVTNQVADSYANLANSNLNWTMKLLTVFTIVLTIPNIVSGFYGQNVAKLPWAGMRNSWLITIIIVIILMIVTIWLMWRSGFLKK